MTTDGMLEQIVPYDEVFGQVKALKSQCLWAFAVIKTYEFIRKYSKSTANSYMIIRNNT